MRIEKVEKYVITMIKTINHLNLRDFIYFNVQNIGSLIDTYNG